MPGFFNYHGDHIACHVTDFYNVLNENDHLVIVLCLQFCL